MTTFVLGVYTGVPILTLMVLLAIEVVNGNGTNDPFLMTGGPKQNSNDWCL